MMRALVRWFDAPAHPHSIAMVRIGLGILLFHQAGQAALELSRLGYFGDSFHLPFFSGLEALPRRLYVPLLAVRLVAAALVVVGVWPRMALATSAVLGLHTLLVDRLQFHHNRYSLLLYALALSLAPAVAHAATLDKPAPTRDERWPLRGVRLAQLQLVLVYLASCSSKLLDADWRGGVVLASRMTLFAHQAVARGVPEGLMHWLASPAVSSVLAKSALLTEAFLAVALLRPRSRVVALWVGTLFHLTIELTSRVEIFTWLTLLLYGLFVTHDVRARTLHYDGESPRGRAVARAVRLLDWLERYEVRAWRPDAVAGRRAVVIVRRDGSRATGFSAWVMMTRTLPLLFPLWGPLALIESFVRKDDVNTGS